MSGYVQGMNRYQDILFPDLLDDYVTEENLARFIDAFVDGLDLVSMGFTHSETKETGRPPYDPADLLKLYLYGYVNSVRSSRKLERECQRNVEVLWLLKKLVPDFKTIADFRKDNVDNIKKVFKELVTLCKGMGLLDTAFVAIDGTKFRAVNSHDRHHNRETVEEDLRHIDEKLTQYLKEMDENDKKEVGESHIPSNVKDLKVKIEKLKERQEKLKGFQTRMEATGETEISETDPESRMMKDHGRTEVCYNGQIVTEKMNKLIVAYDVTNNAHDAPALASMGRQTLEMLGVEKIDVTADKGYSSGMQLKLCKESGITTYIPEADRREHLAALNGCRPEFLVEKFRYDPSTDTYVCPEGKLLTFWRQAASSGDTAIRVYRGQECLGCRFHLAGCTKNKDGRTIKRRDYSETLVEVRARMATIEGKEKFALRKTLVEHPFGTIKRDFNQGYLLLKGLRKVKGELGLTMLAYDLRRIHNILGVRQLISHIIKDPWRRTLPIPMGCPALQVPQG